MNCSYCYFFNGGDETYKKNPAFISKETVGKVVSFLANGCKELSIGKICLNFHGGEPMLQKPHQFDEMCTHFRKTLDPLVDLQLVMQTNGTFYSEEWVELLFKHHVSIGISCDGPEEYHDQFRVDHKGRGSHSLVKENIQASRISEKKPIDYHVT